MRFNFEDLDFPTPEVKELIGKGGSKVGVFKAMDIMGIGHLHPESEYLEWGQMPSSNWQGIRTMVRPGDKRDYYGLVDVQDSLEVAGFESLNQKVEAAWSSFDDPQFLTYYRAEQGVEPLVENSNVMVSKYVPGDRGLIIDHPNIVGAYRIEMERSDTVWKDVSSKKFISTDFYVIDGDVNRLFPEAPAIVACKQQVDDAIAPDGWSTQMEFVWNGRNKQCTVVQHKLFQPKQPAADFRLPRMDFYQYIPGRAFGVTDSAGLILPVSQVGRANEYRTDQITCDSIVLQNASSSVVDEDNWRYNMIPRVEMQGLLVDDFRFLNHGVFRLAMGSPFVGLLGDQDFASSFVNRFLENPGRQVRIVSNGREFGVSIA